MSTFFTTLIVALGLVYECSHVPLLPLQQKHKRSKATHSVYEVIWVWAASNRSAQSQTHLEKNQKILTHTHAFSHSHGGTNEYTNATASLPSLCGQEEHSRHIISECFSSQCDNMSAPVSVTTPHCIDIHQLCSSLGYNTAMPKIWQWKNNSLAFTCPLTRPRAHTQTVTYMHMCVSLLEDFTRCMNDEHGVSAQSLEVCHLYAAGQMNLGSFMLPSDWITFCFCSASRKEKLGTLLYMISGILPEPPVRQNDSLIYWLTDSANSPYIHSKLIPQATLKNYYSATTHIYAPEAKNRRLGAEKAAMGEWSGVCRALCFSFVLFCFACFKCTHFPGCIEHRVII